MHAFWTAFTYHMHVITQSSYTCMESLCVHFNHFSHRAWDIPVHPKSASHQNYVWQTDQPCKKAYNCTAIIFARKIAYQLVMFRLGMQSPPIRWLTVQWKLLFKAVLDALLPLWILWCTPYTTPMPRPTYHTYLRVHTCGMKKGAIIIRCHAQTSPPTLQ